MTKVEILNFLSIHKEQFRQKYQVDQIGLFGSYARGENKEDSDIDIFVKMKPNLFNMVRLKEQIEKALHKEVDIVREHKNIKPVLLEMIQKDITYV